MTMLALLLLATSWQKAPKWWAFDSIVRQTPPAIARDAGWCRTPIDRFVLAKLREKGLKPNPIADRRTLIRRAYFDLTGLPPTPAEVDAFLKDRSPTAWEKLIDRLLASPRYGERWGRHWLDVVHYGDTHGYDKDKRRDNAWPYRDYVIRAFNDDKPYSQFIREELAGDALNPPNPVATGFIAAGPWDFVGQVELAEGTVEKEKTRLLDRDDMVMNAMSTFCSVTIHCARCHDHKFDPITQQDYYRLQAVFAGVERGDRDYDNPEAAEKRRKLEQERSRLTARLDVLKEPIERKLKPLDEAMAHEQKLLALPAQGAASPSNGYHSAVASSAFTDKWVQVDLGSIVGLGGILLIPARPTDFADTPGFGFPLRWRLEVSNDPDFKQRQCLISFSQDDDPNPGDKPVYLAGDGVTARYVRVTATKLWQRTNDYVFALGEMIVGRVDDSPIAITGVSALDSIESGRWSTKYLVDGFTSRFAIPPTISRTWLESSRRLRALDDRWHEELFAKVPAQLRDEITRLLEAIPAVEKKLRELPHRSKVYAVQPHEPRAIHLLARGDVERPGMEVGPGSLACVRQLEPQFAGQGSLNAGVLSEASRRAALANWITDLRNPLTWRSIVNRVWHYHFGRGLVDTPNDFGRNGSLPTHPELLDWLADQFRSQDSIKRLHKLIMTSAVYMQSSADSSAFAKVDGDNRFLWRMNRRRLEAEEIRDSVLAVSGKLDLTMGGPGFELFRFKDDHSPIYDHTAIEKINDPRGWRRAVYRFVVRSVPNPMLECLDCADPSINTPVRSTTTTALQALALLNDPFMIQQSRFLADRVKAGGSGLEHQIRDAFRLAIARYPNPDELRALSLYASRYGLANACRVIYNMNEFVFVD